MIETDCWANWNEINQTQMLSSNSYNNLSINTPEECKEICEKNFACSSVDWTYVTLFHGCWIHKYPYDASKLSSSDTICHHVIDRTIKSTDSCIGGGENFLLTRNVYLNENCSQTTFNMFVNNFSQNIVRNYKDGIPDLLDDYSFR